MVEKKTIKSKSKLSKSGNKRKSKIGNKQTGGNENDVKNYTFTFVSQKKEVLEKRLTLKDKDGNVLSIEQLDLNLKPIFELLETGILSTFLAFSISENQSGGGMDEEIKAGKKFFLEDISSQTNDIIDLLNDITEKQLSVTFKLKNKDKIDFEYDKFSNLIEIVFGLRYSHLYKNENEDITKIVDDLQTENKVLSDYIKNEISELSEINDSDFFILLRFVFGYFAIVNMPELLRELLNLNVNELISIFDNGEINNIQGQGGGGVMDGIIKSYKAHVESKIKDERLDFSETNAYEERNNQIHILETFKYLYNFLIYDDTTFDIFPRKQMKRIHIFFRQEYESLRQHFLFYLCAFSRKRYDMLINFFEQRKLRINYFNLPSIGSFNKNMKQIKESFNKEIERRKNIKTEAEFSGNNNEYVEHCYNKFFGEGEPNEIKQLLGIYSLFYQNSITNINVVNIFNNISRLKPNVEQFLAFSQEEHDDNIKLDSFLFYKRNDSESDNSIYLAIKTSYNESSDNTENTNYESKSYNFKIDDLGNVKDFLGNFDDVFKFGIINTDKRKLFYLQIHEMVNYYRQFKCLTWFTIKASSYIFFGVASGATTAAEVSSSSTASASSYGSSGHHLRGVGGLGLLGYLGLAQFSGPEVKRSTAIMDQSEYQEYSSKKSKNIFFTSNDVKNSLYVFDQYIFTTPKLDFYPITTKINNYRYNLYKEITTFDYTFCSGNAECRKLHEINKNDKWYYELGRFVRSALPVLLNKATDTPCIIFSKTRINYLKEESKKFQGFLDSHYYDSNKDNIQQRLGALPPIPKKDSTRNKPFATKPRAAADF